MVAIRVMLKPDIAMMREVPVSRKAVFNDGGMSLSDPGECR